MNGTDNNLINKEWQQPYALKVWRYEAEISKAIYKFWCKITGGSFEVRENSCLLVTKRGLHLFSKMLSRNLDIAPSKLEVYEMNCPKNSPYGLGITAYSYRFLKNANCSFCDRFYEVQEGDKKRIGKF